MTEFSLALAAAACLLAILACLCVARIAVRVRELQDVQAVSASSSPESLRLRVDSLTTQLEEVAVALGDLAQRVKMQKVRNAANHVRDEMPDPYRDPDGWRRAMNSKLSRGKVPP